MRGKWNKRSNTACGQQIEGKAFLALKKSKHNGGGLWTEGFI